jgi:hypothetical protein
MIYKNIVKNNDHVFEILFNVIALKFNVDDLGKNEIIGIKNFFKLNIEKSA